MSIRPFQFRASDEALADLKRRITATKWPNKEPIGDATQGVQLATMQKLAHYWATDYPGHGREPEIVLVLVQKREARPAFSWATAAVRECVCGHPCRVPSDTGDA
jgi:hypothetical protein